MPDDDVDEAAQGHADAVQRALERHGVVRVGLYGHVDARARRHADALEQGQVVRSQKRRAILGQGGQCGTQVEGGRARADT